MAKLGYTWYPKDWWTSRTFRKLRKKPILRYIYREVIDYLYSNGKPMVINSEEIEELFFVELSKKDIEELSLYFDLTEDGLWWSNQIQIRLNKAQTARENGKKGGRPPKEKNPKTQKINPEKNPRNPPLEREREREREIKGKIGGVRVENGIYRKEDFLPPTKEEFIRLGLEKRKDVDKQSLALKFDGAQESGWTNGKGEPIKNWRAWLINSLAYLPAQKIEEKPFIRKYTEYTG